MRSVFEFIRQKMKFEVRNVRRKNDGSEKKNEQNIGDRLFTLSRMSSAQYETEKKLKKM